MKTRVSRQNVMPKTPLFARRCTKLGRNRGKADVLLQENERENSNRSGHIELAGHGWKNWVGQSLPDGKEQPENLRLNVARRLEAPIINRRSQIARSADLPMLFDSCRWLCEDNAGETPWITIAKFEFRSQ